MHLKRYGARRWIYLPLDAAVELVCLEKVETYVLHRYNNIAQYIANRPILELYMLAEIRKGEQVSMRWWEQAVLVRGQGGLNTDTDTEKEG